MAIPQYVKLEYTANGVDYTEIATIQNTGSYKWDASGLMGSYVKLKVSKSTEPPSDLDYIDEAEISMLTVDGSSGASTYQLHAISLSATDISNTCNWSSSNESAIIVNATGLCTAVGAGSSTITCQKGATTRTCVVTGYTTMPSTTVLKTLKGGAGGNTPGSTAAFVTFTCPNYIPSTQNSCREDAIQYAPGSGLAGYRTTAYEQYMPLLAGLWPTVRRVQSTSYSSQEYGPLVSGTLYDYTISKSSGGYKYNGITMSAGGSASSAVVNENYLTFRVNTKKILISSSTASSITEAQLASPSSCQRFYCGQDYIRYTDISGTRTNYTIIPNRGSLGSNYNMSATNVPADWFAV
jgi:hypothetical protein